MSIEITCIAKEGFSFSCRSAAGGSLSRSDPRSIEKLKSPGFYLDPDNVETVMNAQALGVYTYILLLLKAGFKNKAIIEKKMCDHFGLTEEEITKDIKKLIDLNLLSIKEV